MTFRLVRFAIAKAGTFAVLFVVIVGLIFGGLRLLLPVVSAAYRDQVVQLIGERTGLHAEVDRMGLQLVGWWPRLTMEGVRLNNPSDHTPLLSLRRLRLDLNPLASFASWSPVIEGAILEGARLELRLRSDGSLVLTGLERLRGERPSGDLGFFLNEGRLVLRESEILWVNERFLAAPIHIVEVAVDLHNQGEHHRLEAQGHLSGEQDAVLEVRGDLSSDSGNPAGLSGEVYFRLRGRDLIGLMGQQGGLALRLQAGKADLESWGGIEGGRLNSFVQRFGLENLHLLSPQGQGFAADKLEGLWRWRREVQGWSLDATDLVLVRDGRAWPTTHLSLWSGQAGSGEEMLVFGVDFLDLADTAAIARLLLADRGDLVSALEGIRPEGAARNLQLVAHRGDTAGIAWSARGELSGLAMAPWRAWPGIHGLDAEVEAHTTGGVARLRSEDLQVSLPRLFRETLGASRLEGELAWSLDGETRTLELWAPDLHLENPDLVTRTRVELSLPLDGGSPFLDIQTDFRDGNAARTGRYLPVGIMPPQLVAWLERAIVSGRVPRGTFLLRGPLVGFPYQEGNGRFEVAFDAADVILDYQPQWPRLEGVGAEVRFLNEGLEIRANDGRILDSRIEGAEVRIPDLAHTPTLEILGSVTGPFADGLRILRESPLAEHGGRYVRGMTGEGDSRIELELAMPLQEGKDPRVAGSLDWNGDAALRLDDWGLELEQIKGRLKFGESSVAAEDLGARLWDQPVVLDLATLEVSGRKLTRVSGRGRIGPQTFAALHPSPLWRSLKGIPLWSLRLDIPHKGEGAEDLPVHFALESDLRGLDVSLPPPFRKPAAAKRRFTLEGNLTDGPNLDIDARYGELWARLGLMRSGGGGLWLVSGDLGSGAPEARPISESGLRVKVSLDELDLTQWLVWLGGASPRPTGARPDLPLPLEDLDLRVKVLQLAQIQCSEAHLWLGQDAESWRLNLTSPEILGQVALPKEGEKPVGVVVDRLDLKALIEKLKDSKLKQGENAGTDPRRLPPLDVKITELAWGENPLGRVDLLTRPVAEGMDIAKLRVAGPLISIDGNGRWVREAPGQRTSLGLKGHSDDLGQLSRLLEFDSLLDRAPADATLELTWPDAPFAPAPGRFTGRVEFQVGAGSLLDVDPGFGRVLGVLNLDALRRRLSLDFTDLVKQGFAFDGIEGTLDLQDGMARIEDLRIEGVSARVRVSGETDLSSQEFNQLVTVIPDVSSSLVVAGAVAGGPLVGAAALLADKLIGKEVDKLSQYQYRVTGPWQSPVFERVNEAAGRSVEEGETTEPSNPFVGQ